MDQRVGRGADDARGGAALSIKAVTGKPIKFVGTGEKADALEPFYPDRMASRILDMGDVLSLIEKAESAFEGEDVDELHKKIKTDHALAEELWASGNHDARVLATMIADPAQMKSQTLETWAKELDNYVLTDALSGLAAPSDPNLMVGIATAGWFPLRRIYPA